MRRSATVLALVTLLLAPGPALAQEPSPSPSTHGVCPNVSYVVDRDDKEGPPDVPVTIEGGSDVQPAMTPDRWTATRISPGPVEVVGTIESSPTFSFTFTVAQTTTFRIEAVGPEGCGPSFTDFTRTVTSPSPTPSPTLSPSHRDVACPSFTVEAPATAHVGDLVPITATVINGEAPVRFQLNRERPAPFAVVRRSDTHTATITWSVRLGETHAFTVFASRDHERDCIGGGTQTNRFPVIAVRPSLSIAAVRNGPRDYSFTGRILPGRGQLVTLYRHTPEGSRVITSQSRVQPDGLYRFDRRFSGSGRFGFSVAVGASATNLAGSSATRPTVIH